MKKFNFFEKLWEHGRTLRRVGLVLVMCLIAIPQVWGYGSSAGTVVYFDMQDCSGFGTPYFRVGRTTALSRSYQLSLVGGTKYLYSYPLGQWDNYDAFSVANGKGWTGDDGNSTIYQPHSGQYENGKNKTGYDGDKIITKQTTFMSENISGNYYIKIGSTTGSLSYNCQYYDRTNGSLPTYSISYDTPSNGTLTVQKYTGSSYTALASGTTGLKPTQIIKVTTSPSTHYGLASLTVTGATQIDGGDTYYITGNCTVTATFAPKWTIKGGNSNDTDGSDAMGDWATYNNLTYTGTANTYSGTITLAANTTYRFKVVDRDNGTPVYWGYGGSDAYHLTFLGQSGASEALGTNSSNKENLALMSAGAGTYTFTWNSSSHTLTVDFPTVTHPSTDYIYYKDYDNYDSHGDIVAHVWGGSTASTGDQRMPVVNSFNFDGTTYFYAALGNNTKAMFAGSDNTATYKTEDLNSASSKKGKFYDKSSNSSESTRWQPFTATLTLDHQGPCSNTPNPNSVTVTYGATSNINTDVISTRANKSNYTWGGYYTEQGGEGIQIINTSEKIPSNLDGYTSSGKWIKTGSSVSATIYAKWTQTPKLGKNGGTADGSATVAFNGTSMKDITEPTFAGYTVDGYYKESGCSNLIMSANGTLATSTDYTDASGKWIRTSSAPTLHAHWKINPPTITNECNKITISTTAAETTIYYTTDGSTPTNKSSVYDPSNKPTLASNTTVKAFAIKSGCTDSEVATEVLSPVTTYSVNYNANLDGTSGSTASQTGHCQDDVVATSACGFSKDNYKFKWWNTAENGSGEDFYARSDAGESVTFTSSANIPLYAQWEEVPSGWAYWVGDVNIAKNSYGDVTGNGCTMRITSTNVDWNNDISKDWTQVSSYSSNDKRAKVLAIDTKNTKYLTVNFTDGSPINTLKLGVCNKNGSDKQMIVIYSTTADFSSGEGEKVTFNTQQYTQTTKAVYDASPAVSNKYPYARVYMQLDESVYGQTGGSGNTIRIYSIKAQKGAGCSAAPTVSAATTSTTTPTSQIVNCAGISSLGTGTCTISDYGFVYGTSEDPTTSDNKVQVGTTYTTTNTAFGATTLESLTPGTTYYVRPYATNGCGTAYGTGTSFTTHYAITTGSHTNGSVTIPSSAAPSTTVNISATPNTGYHFTSWDVYQTGSSSTKVTLANDDDEDGKTRSFTMPSYAVTVDAAFVINSWTLSWDFDGGSSSETAGTDYTSGSTNYGVTIDYPGNKTMSKEGYTFTGWDSSPETMPDNDLKITALWSANTYDVASHTLSNVTLSSGGATGTGKATYGTNYTATFAANTGYNLPSDVTVQIGGDTKTKGEEYSWNSSTGELSINGSAILGNIAISVTAVAKTYTLTLKENGGTDGDGSATITWNQRLLSYSSQPSAPNASFSLDGYYTAATGGTKIISGGSSYIVGKYIEGWTTNTDNPSWARDDDATLYAHWRRVVLLNENSDYHGSTGGNVMVMLDGGPFSYTTATGESGYTLQGYYTEKLGGTKVFNADGTYAADDVDGYIDDGAWVYTTSGTLSLYAHWAKEFTVTYNGNSQTTGTAPAAQTNKAYGTTVTVASNSGSLAKTGYSFVGWNTANDGSGTFYAVGSTFTITGDITLYAQWESCGSGSTVYVIGYTNSDGTSQSSSASYRALSVSNTWNTSTSPTYTDKTSTDGFTITANQASYYWCQGSTSFNSSSTGATMKCLKLTSDKTITIKWTNSSLSFSKVKIIGLNAAADDPTTYSVSNGTSSESFTFAKGNSTPQTKEISMSFTYGNSNGVTISGDGPKEIRCLIELSNSGCSTYNVSFANMTGFVGETTLPSTVTGVYGGSTIAEPVTPTADGYAFAGWYKESACSNAWDFTTDAVEDDITLYAKWVSLTEQYTFHMGDGDISNHSWNVTTFTPTGYYENQAISNFEIPNQDRYPSFFVGYEGEFVEDVLYVDDGYSKIREWDDYYNMGSYQSGYIKIQGNASPISDGNTKTAAGAKGTLQMSSSTHSENWGLVFIPDGFGLTISYMDDETPRTLIVPLRQTDNEKVWETESFTTAKGNALTAAQIAGTFKVGLATATPNVYVDCYQTTEEAASAINARKLVAAYGGADMAAGASGRFQIIMSSNTSLPNFGLRWVPLENHTKQSGSWDGMGVSYTLSDKWSLEHAPTIEEDVYIEHYTSITNDAQANSVYINKSTAYMNLTISSIGSLLVMNDIKAKMAGDDAYRATTENDIKIETEYIYNGSLITAKKSTDTKASYRFCTKAYKVDGYGYINQFIGIPFSEMDAFQLYGSLLYQYDKDANKWVTCSQNMEAYHAYNILRRSTEGRAVFDLDGTLILPGIEAGNKEKVLECNSGRSAEASSWRGEHLFANSWTAPIEIGAMTNEDFVGVDPTIYIFNAGSVNTATEKEKEEYDLGDNPGQWTALPVNDVKEHPENYSYKVIPAMQAFSIRATAPNGTLTLDYKKHVYDPIMANSGVVDHTALRAPKQNTDLPSIRLWLIVTGESLYKDDAQIHERADFSDGHDAGWDGYKIFGNAHSPQLYTMSDNNQLSVNAIPNIEGTVVGFRKGSDDNVYTFSFKYNGEEEYYLNDLKEQTSTLISNENTYIFTAEEGDTEARFIISATPINAPAVTTDIDNVSDGAKARKIMINDKLYIILNGKMYDATGKAVK